MKDPNRIDQKVSDYLERPYDIYSPRTVLAKDVQPVDYCNTQSM